MVVLVGEREINALGGGQGEKKNHINICHIYVQNLLFLSPLNFTCKYKILKLKMPSLTSRLFNHNQSNKQQQEASCCSCGCHHHQHSNNNISEETSTIILSPTRWFPRIRRRSSSTSSCTSFFDENSTSSANSSRRASAEYIHEIEDKQIDEFEDLYRLAVDEVCCAIRMQLT